MNTLELIRPQLDRLQRIALIAGVVGAIGTVIGYFLDPANFFHSYLFAYMFWLGVTLGSLAWLMIHHVAGSGSLFLVRRLLEAATRNLPVMALLFLPIVLGIPALYEWSHADVVRNDAILQAKAPYLNVPFFLARAVFYFVVWGALAFFFNKWSASQDRGDDPGSTHRFNLLGATGLVLYVLTMTFAAFDWMMSLTPHWMSSLFGVIIIVGQGLSTLCLMQVLVTMLTRGTAIRERVPQRYFRDLGNLTLAFVLLWAYMNFSQWVIIWSGNIAEEAGWYTQRTQNSWLWIGTLLIVAHFVIPFASLLSSALKVKIENLAKLAMFLIVMRFIDLFWYIAPTFRGEFSITVATVADIAAPIGLGGIWLSLWAAQMKKAQTLLAPHDPRFSGQWEEFVAAAEPAGTPAGASAGTTVNATQGVSNHV